MKLHPIIPIAAAIIIIALGILLINREHWTWGFGVKHDGTDINQEHVP